MMIPIGEHFCIPWTRPIYYAAEVFEEVEVVESRIFSEEDRDDLIRDFATRPRDKDAKKILGIVGRRLLEDDKKNMVDNIRGVRYEKRNHASTSLEPLIKSLELSMTLFAYDKSWVPWVFDDPRIGRMRHANRASDAALLEYIREFGANFDLTSAFLDNEHEIDSDKLEWHLDVRYIVGSLNSLFTVYLCWCYLEWGERGEVERLIKATWVYAEYVSEHGETSSFADICRSLIEYALAFGTCTTAFRYHNGILCEQLHTYSLQDACMYQLLSIVTSGESAREGRIVSDCKQCGNQYMKSHGSSSLCGECKTPSAKSKAYRERQKAKKKAEKEAANAEKEREQ